MYLFVSITNGCIGAEFAAATAVVTIAVLINVPTSDGGLLCIFPVVVFAAFRVESSESYSSSLLLDDVRK
jgi:hypothetical protein